MNDNNKTLLVSAALLLSFILVQMAHSAEPKPGTPEAAYQAATVRICAMINGGVEKCGTGVFVSSDTILTAYHVVSPVEVGELTSAHMVAPDLVVLRESDSHFKPAILLKAYQALDIALLRFASSDKIASLHNVFHRGQKAWAIGNPGGRDMVVVETSIVGIEPMQKNDGHGFNELIMLDSKGNAVRSGFSGGGLFTESGLVGVIQMCNGDNETCLAMPTRLIRTQINDALKEK